METRDWSLVFFTVLTQAAVGAFVTLQVLSRLSHRRRARGGARTADAGPEASPAGQGARHRPPVPRADPAAGDWTHAGDGARDHGPEAGGGRGAPVPLALVLAVLSAGLVAALFHLSTPLQAARAVVNFSSSWLSREIVFGSLFAALLGALVLLERRAGRWAPGGRAPANPAQGRRADRPARENPTHGRRAISPAPPRAAATGPALATWLARLAAAAGLVFLGCQIAIYLLPAQPAWNSFATPAAFGGTALRLGVLGVAAGLAVRHLATGNADDPVRPGGAVSTRPGREPDQRQQAQRVSRSGGAVPAPPPREPDRRQPARRVSRTRPAVPAPLQGLALTAVAALGLEFVAAPLHLAALGADPSPAAAASVQRLTGDYGGVLLLRLGLLGVAAAALGGVLAVGRGLCGPSGRAAHRGATALTCGAFVLVLVSEVCGRFLFYAMQVRVGI